MADNVKVNDAVEFTHEYVKRSKKATSVYLTWALIEEAKKRNLNISKLCEAALEAALKNMEKDKSG